MQMAAIRICGTKVDLPPGFDFRSLTVGAAYGLISDFSLSIAQRIKKGGRNRPFCLIISINQGTRPVPGCDLAVAAYEPPWLQSGEYARESP